MGIWKREGQARRTPTPSSGVLRRERRALLELREERLRDLGGLLLEMYRRNRFRDDLVRERCEELVEIDERVGEIDALLGLVWTAPDSLRCSCGAPLPLGSRFCGMCGRSVDDGGSPGPGATEAGESAAEIAER